MQFYGNLPVANASTFAGRAHRPKRKRRRKGLLVHLKDTSDLPALFNAVTDPVYKIIASQCIATGHARDPGFTL